MGSRGAVARNKHYVDTEYKTVKVLSHGEKVLEGNRHIHTMPDYSHSANMVYIIYRNGIFHALRVYDDDHMPVIEIAFHPEPNLNHGNRKDPIWHMHIYTKGCLDHNEALLITQEIKTKYREILEDIGYDQW